MTTENVAILGIEALISSLGRMQVGCEPDVDSNLGYRMWGGKDSTGAVYKFLGKNKPGSLSELTITGLSGVGSRILKVDEDGLLIQDDLIANDLPDHNDLNGLTTGDPHTQYMLKSSSDYSFGAGIDAILTQGLKIGNAVGTANGTIRWTGSDFEGRKAGAWVSLTSTGGGGGGGTWGSITGTLSDQTDLNSALSGKEPTLTKGNLTESTSSVLTITGGTSAVIGSGLTIQVKASSTSQSGYLSNTDWNIFNGKQNALTIGNLTEATSSVLTITGGSSSIIGSGLFIQVKQAGGAQSGYLSSTDWTTFNNKQSALSFGNVTESTSSVLSITGGSGAVIGSGLSIQVAQASTSTAGYLSSADWNTFNNKQSSLSFANLTGTNDQVNLSASGTGVLVGSTSIQLSLPQSIATTSSPTFASLTLGSSGLNLKDTNASHNLNIVAGSDLTANRILTLTTGDSARTITLSGNPTLDDWFDQSVKSGASPTFANITDSGLTANTVLYANGSKVITSSSVSLTTLGYLDLTSSGQTQLNTKFTNGGDSFTSAASIGTNDAFAFNLKSNNVTRISLDSAGGITFNSAYTFPITDGTLNYVLSTDGAGALSWVAQSGGGGSSTLADIATNSSSTAHQTFALNASTQFIIEGSSGTDIFTIDEATATVGLPTLTASRALTLDSSGKIAVSSTTNTKLGYISTLDSDAQEQLNTKQLPPTVGLDGMSTSATTPAVGTPIYSSWLQYTTARVSGWRFRCVAFTSTAVVEIGLFKKTGAANYEYVTGSKNTVTVSAANTWYDATLSTPFTESCTASTPYYIGFLLVSGSMTVLKSGSLISSASVAFTGATGASTLPATETTENPINSLICVLPF
jgi:hypothetical protein